MPSTDPTARARATLAGLEARIAGLEARLDDFELAFSILGQAPAEEIPPPPRHLNCVWDSSRQDAL